MQTTVHEKDLEIIGWRQREEILRAEVDRLRTCLEKLKRERVLSFDTYATEVVQTMLEGKSCET